MDHKQIKLFVSPSDHDRIRLAAALCRTPMSEFSRQIVVAEAKRLTDGLPLAPQDDTVTNPITTPKTPHKRSQCK
jgi:hypothetical protein